MSFWKKLFGNRSDSLRERDNRGTRFDNASVASSYWMARISSPKKDPFLLYTFPTEAGAREALLQVPCIRVASDSGNLVCTEVLTFGCYANESGGYEAFLCGADLTHDVWSQAKASFVSHGGKPRGQGELEPERTAAPKIQAAPQPGKVKFVREDRETKMGATLTYRIHRAPDAASAMAFLQDQPVNKQLYYVVVETPEGNYCRDIQGIYKE
ncbi:MAG TPA: hypothetical protein VNA69_21345 [Thermoanaerobaculia bacterium]|nr:hypothetical protein [Thermoanaerobaculia bacterium]